MPQTHHERIRTIISEFERRMQEFAGSLERLSGEEAIREPAGGGWNAARIGAHVAMTNELLAGVISGAVPMAEAAGEVFTENPAVFSGLPPKVQTFPQLEPPTDATRDAAIARLKSSAAPVLGALRGLDESRAASHVTKFSFGTLSMYQLGEFIASHVGRHQEQLQRVTQGISA